MDQTELDRRVMDLTCDALDAVKQIDKAAQYSVLTLALGNAMTVLFGQQVAAQSLATLGAQLFGLQVDVQDEIRRRVTVARMGRAS